MKDKVCIVTGASSGIGRKSAFLLAQKGATVIMLCRDRTRGTESLDEIVRTTGNRKTQLMIADLSSQASIRQAASDFLNIHQELHVLVNNAGVAVRKRTLSPDRIEMTFAVNHLAPFLLTHLLLKRLEAGAPARIINVSSEAHRNVKPDFFENLQGEKKFSGLGAYSITKLCNILFTRELATRLAATNVTVNALHPGYLHTGIFREAPGFLRFLVRLTAGHPDVGANAVAHLAQAPELERVSGKYFNRTRIVNSSPFSQDADAATQLWELSAQLTGLDRVI